MEKSNHVCNPVNPTRRSLEEKEVYVPRKRILESIFFPLTVIKPKMCWCELNISMSGKDDWFYFEIQTSVSVFSV